MKKSVTIAAAVIAVLGASLLAASPASADTTLGTVTTVPMTVDCAHTTAAQIDAARATGWDICETSSSASVTRSIATPYDTVTADCGTASIYVDRIAKGKGRISWSMFSAKGPILHRDLSISWGPAGGGKFLDVNFMNSEDYSNTKHVLGSGTFKANMHGFVVVGSAQVSCTIPAVYSNSVKI